VLGILLILGVACLGSVPGDIARFLPASDAVPGWTRQGDLRTYSSDNLYELVDGQADAFLAYGFAQAALGRYVGPQGTGMRIEIFRLATPADAYGLFSASIAGEPIAIGAGGDTDPGRRLAFWQERYYVRIQATQPVANEVLLRFGQKVSEALPAGGEPPDIVVHLPSDGLRLRSIRFFRQEISIQPWLWLGDGNLLGLSAETQGVLADYELDGRKARLLLVIYTRAADAEQALKALQYSGTPNMVFGQVQGERLVAVFGDLQLEDGKALVNKVLR